MAERRKTRRRFGNIAKQRSGNHRARYRNPEDPTQWINAPRTFPTKAAADAWLTKVEARILEERWIHPDQEKADAEAAEAKESADAYTLNEWVTTWLDQLRAGVKSGDYSESTVRVYKSNIKRLSKAFGDRPIRSLTEDELRTWYLQLPTTEKISAQLQKNIYRCASSCLHSALEQKVILAMPLKVKGATKKIPTQKGPLSSLPSDAQTWGMIDAALPPIAASIVLANFAGLRQSEISALTRSALILSGDNPRVIVKRATKRTERGGTVVGKTKSNAANREIPLTDVPLKWLKSYVADHVDPGPDSLVVYRPLAKTFLTSDSLHKGQKRWKYVRELVGLPDSFDFHDLRRACLTRAGQAGATLAELKTLAGHEDAETVMLYQVVEKERMRNLMNSIGGGKRPAAKATRKPRAKKATSTPAGRGSKE